MQRLQLLLDERKLDALWLRRVSSFAWATCGGASYINTASSEGGASLLFTRRKRYLVCNNIEIHRLEQEEGLAGQGWQPEVLPWFTPQDQVSRLAGGSALGADLEMSGAQDVSADLAWMRAQLTGPEQERFRVLGRLCAGGMMQAVQSIQPGMTELKIAGLLADAMESQGVQLVVNLVACDERILAYRHPLPKDRPLKRYAMLVACGRKWGLICSLTRLVYFGKLPDALRRKAEATALVDAVLISATRPGRSMGEVFQQAQYAYASAGFPDEWHLHHQGGLAGYEPREIVAAPDTPDPIKSGQAYAWNPSITGTKSEDTILVGDDGNQVLTQIDGWPLRDIQMGAQTVQRPEILEL
ncbi:MAG: peptidase M24 [Chloroflexi bacterium RBG_16_54_18]|nr:MAG: peptidase M24 [Chloroflexi bacterium RBG_16_54_18]